MTRKKIISFVLALLVTLILGACLYLNSLLPIITGYAAKNLCSAIFVSSRAKEDVEAVDLHFSFIKYTRNKVDYNEKSVTSSFLAFAFMVLHKGIPVIESYKPHLPAYKVS